MLPAYTVPVLDVDKRYGHGYGPRMTARQRVERRIVAAMIEYLRVNGWAVTAVDYGDDRVAAHDAKSAMETIFDLDDAYVFFANRATTTEQWVRLVMGNDGDDVINDYQCRATLDFGRLMDRFVDDGIAEIIANL